MPRALSREEQLVLGYVRRQSGAVTIPQLAETLSLPADAVQELCAYLVSRKLLAVSIYAVSAAGANSASTVPLELASR